MGKFIPLSIPNFEGNEEKYVLDAVKQGWVSTGGAYINELEDKLAEFLQAPAVMACQSGTSALHLALRECGVEPGDMVIVPTLTFIAAVNPVKYQFADPVFMDCDDSLCIDPVKLEAFCETECRREVICKEACDLSAVNAPQQKRLVYKKTGQQIKALVVVHIFGNLADMERIMEIAEKYGLAVVEDATEALGSKFLTGKYAGKMAGTIGDFGAYSFNGNKIITTGGGGALTARDKDKLLHMKYISTQAKDDPLFYIHDEIGFNYRMTNLQAALGVAQVEELPEFIRRKQENYQYYCDKFQDFSKGKMLEFRPDTESNCWFYSLLLDKEKVSLAIRVIIEKLQEQGIQTRPIWGLIHEQKPYLNDVTYEIEKAKYYSERIINIPCSTQLTKEEIDEVVEQIKDIL